MQLQFVGFVAVFKYLLIAKALLEASGQRCLDFFVLNKMKKGTRRNKMFYEEVELAGC